MPPDGVQPGSPEDWLRHARSDILVASQSLPEGALYETLCFHAQQAAEKAIKAALQHSGTHFPYTHDVARLITIVQQAGLDWPASLDAAAELTEYAVETRYPGTTRPVSAADYRVALDVARRVLEWAENMVHSS